MQRNPLAVLLAGLIAAPALAAQDYQLEDVVVTATRIPMPDVTAPYASEVHTRDMIDSSGAATLYEYLGQHTSVSVLPSYGNKFAPKIDMRGYGIGDGYQNIVVTLDGRRLNNIDMTSQLLGSIALDDIDRIEITKGSGAVLYGDGATAGSIQIYSRTHAGVAASVAAGNFGRRVLTASAGVAKEAVTFSVSAGYDKVDGYSDADVAGHKDASSNRTWHGGLELRPVERLKLGLDLASSRIDTRYVGALSLAEFDADPSQNGGNTYTHQKFELDTWRVVAGLELGRNWHLSASHSRDDKVSNFVDFNSVFDYEYVSDDLAMQYRSDALEFMVGVQTFDGTRTGASDRTSKENTAWYAQGQYRWGDTTLSAGARAENVEYTYLPDAGTRLAADHELHAWDIGVNHRLNSRLSVFANFDRAFQAPDIDRFFATDFSAFPFVTSFNGFIQPATSRTFNIGFNHVTRSNRLKATLFHADLDNEVYFFSTGPWSGMNTNLDKTHKYGLELQDAWRTTDALTLSLNYAYTRAIIDQENSGGGAFNGKDLPGVPRHGVTLSARYTLGAASSLQLTHTWRSSAWAAEDFDNNNAQKQAAYQSTDIAWRYQRQNTEWFANVENLFEHKNGLWIADDAIYPVNFTRNWRVGLKVQF